MLRHELTSRKDKDLNLPRPVRAILGSPFLNNNNSSIPSTLIPCPLNPPSSHLLISPFISYSTCAFNNAASPSSSQGLSVALQNGSEKTYPVANNTTSTLPSSVSSAKWTVLEAMCDMSGWYVMNFPQGWEGSF